jgi:hypothetical protein
MIIRRAIDSVRTRDWPALFSELVVVVLGIFIAIQADSWWQHQSDLRQEASYLSRLVNDVTDDIENIEYGIRLATLRKELADVLIAAAENPDGVRERPVKFLIAVEQSAYTFTPSLNSNTFEELRSTGNLGLLRNNELKSALFDYFRYDQGARQFMSLQLMQEFRHFEVVAGVLSTEQAKWVQDNLRIANPDRELPQEATGLEIDGIVEAAVRLSNMPEAIAWLPEARGMQLELIGTHTNRLERAKALLEILTDGG